MTPFWGCFWIHTLMCGAAYHQQITNTAAYDYHKQWKICTDYIHDIGPSILLNKVYKSKGLLWYRLHQLHKATGDHLGILHRGDPWAANPWIWTDMAQRIVTGWHSTWLGSTWWNFGIATASLPSFSLEWQPGWALGRWRLYLSPSLRNSEFTTHSFTSSSIHQLREPRLSFAIATDDADLVARTRGASPWGQVHRCWGDFRP